MKINTQGPVADYINTLVSYITMSFVFSILCIPVFTIGPCLAGLYGVTMKDARKEYGYYLKTFFHGIKGNFKRSLACFLLLGLPALVCLFGIAFYVQFDSAIGTLLTVVLLAVLVLLLGTMEYVFPYITRFEDSVKATISNAHQMSVQHMGWTLLLVASDAAILFGMYESRTVRGIMIFLGFSFLALCRSYLFKRIFQEYEQQE